MERPLKCFVSAPPRADTSVLRAVLHEKGVEIHDVYDFQVGDSLYDSVKKRIRESDFAIIVISELNPNVFYEMGVCVGVGKPIFAILDRDVALPDFAHRYMYLTTNLEQGDLLRISLNKFVDEILAKKLRTTKKPARGKSIGRRDTLIRYLDQIRRFRIHGKSQDIEQLAKQVFDELRLHYAFKEHNIRDKGVDFAVWNDSLTSSLGNPILIEIKYGVLTPEKMYHIERQLQHYLKSSDAKAAILLYLDKDNRRFTTNYSLDPLVLRYDFEDFIYELSQSSFEDIVLSRRNKMVHGV